MTDKKRPLRHEDLPVMNLGKFVLEKIKAYKNLEAVVDASSGKTYTYNCLIRRCEGLAAGLQQFGVRSGDIICIFSPNHIDYMTVCYATALAGGVLQCINSLLTKDDLHKMMMDGNTKFIITIPDLVPTVKAATHDLAGIKIITFGHCAGCTSLDSLIASSDTHYTTPEVDWTRATSTLWYSSGTTGFPYTLLFDYKCCIEHIKPYTTPEIYLNHIHVMILKWDDRFCDASRKTHWVSSFKKRGSKSVYGTGQSLVMFLPMFHAYGMLMCIVGHCLGCRLVVMSRFDADKYLGLIEKYKPINLQVVPPIMVLLAKYPNVPDYDLSSVKRIICAGAPLSAEVEDAVIERLRSIQQVQQGYGMTEVGFTHYHTVEETRRHSVGKVMELTEMKIVDVKTGRTCGVNEAGEIWVRGPQASHGYLNLPNQTKAMFMDDGWVRTGDIGKQDADGFLYIVDRLKDLIKYKANQVAPASLEDILLRHDAVADVGVIGVSDVEACELPKAYVVKKQGRSVTERELQDFVAGQVAPYMKLRGGVEFVEQIPRTMSGKILRRVLRERANNTVSKL